MFYHVLWCNSMTKLTNTYTHIGSSNAPKVARGRNMHSREIKREDGSTYLSNTNETLRQSIVKETADTPSDEIKLNKKALKRGKIKEKYLVEMMLDELYEITDKENIKSTYPVTEAIKLDDYRIASSCDHLLFFHKPVDIVCPWTKKVFTFQGQVVNEVKTDGWNSGEPHMDFYDQLQHQLICTGAEYGLITKEGPHQEFHITPYLRDEAWIDGYLEKVEEFWHHTDNDIPFPPPNNEKYIADLNTMDSSEELLDLMISYKRAEEEHKNHGDSIKEMKTMLINVLTKFGCEKGFIGTEEVPDLYSISCTQVQRQAQPEKLTPAKPAGKPFYKLTINLNKDKVQ